MGIALAEPQATCIDTSILENEGTPVGKEEVVDGGEISVSWKSKMRHMLIRPRGPHLPVTLYISEPKGDVKPKAAVLYLTDVFGIQLVQNKL